MLSLNALVNVINAAHSLIYTLFQDTQLLSFVAGLHVSHSHRELLVLPAHFLKLFLRKRNVVQVCVYIDALFGNLLMQFLVLLAHGLDLPTNRFVQPFDLVQILDKFISLLPELFYLLL